MSRNYELIEPQPVTQSAAPVSIADPIIDFTSPQYYTIEQKTLAVLERIEATLVRIEAYALAGEPPYKGPSLEEMITKLTPTETPFMKSVEAKPHKKGRLDGTR